MLRIFQRIHAGQVAAEGVTDYDELSEVLALEMPVMIRQGQAPLLEVRDEVVNALDGVEVGRKVAGPAAATHSDYIKLYLIEVRAEIL